MTPTAPILLTAVSSVLEFAPPFTEIMDAEHPLLWRRRGAGLVGYGCSLRLEFRGPTRVTDAARAWAEVAASASVSDSVNLPGSGLVAFGTFAFADDSDSVSVLIVPELVIGRRERTTFVTTITAAGQKERDAAVPAIVPLGARPHAQFYPGSQTPDGYRDSVLSATEAIRAGQVSKVVLARDLLAADVTGDSRHMIAELADRYPDCWTFSVDGLVGSSPETLVRVLDGTIDARVLAGTAARGTDPDSDLEAATHLATSSKDLDEHAFAVRSVTDVVAPFAEHLSTGESPFTLRLANLWHLATDVSGHVRDGATSLDVVAALHPTAAVAGTPRDAALDLIDTLEPFDRRRYAGPVGWVDAAGDGEWAIALRCVEIDGTTVTAYAGAGIVVNSNPDAELRETEMKFRPVVDALSAD